MLDLPQAELYMGKASTQIISIALVRRICASQIIHRLVIEITVNERPFSGYEISIFYDGKVNAVRVVLG